MKKIFLAVIGQLAFLLTIAQVQTHLIGDTVRIHSNSGTGELILQNASDSVTGFLYNKGGGRTEFRRALVKLNDTLYLIGADTLLLKSFSGSYSNLSNKPGLQDITLVGDSTTNRVVARKLVTDSLVTHNATLYLDSMVLRSNISKNTLAITDSTWKNNSGYNLTAIGNKALSNNTTGYFNTAIGTYSLWSNTTGFHNIAIGASALASVTTASYNTAIGAATLYADSTGEQNTAIGDQAMQLNKTGIKNIALGVSAMFNAYSGNYNTAIGNAAFDGLSSGSNNVGIGYRSGYSNASGNNNTFIGYQTGYYDIGSGNVMIGFQAGNLETGNNKLYIANTNTTMPLIGGDFSIPSLTFNGSVTTTGKQSFSSTITPTGTTGIQMINTPSGTVNIAAGNTTVTVTNSLVTANSIVIPVIRTSDATAVIKNVVPSAGSFTITLTAAATSETSIGFIVYN